MEIKQGDIYLIEEVGREQYVHLGNQNNPGVTEREKVYSDVYSVVDGFCTVKTEEFNGSLAKARLMERQEEIPVYSLYGADRICIADIAVALNKLDVGKIVKGMYRKAVEESCKKMGLQLSLAEVKDKYGVDLTTRLTTEQFQNLVGCLAKAEAGVTKEVSLSVFSEITSIADVLTKAPELLCNNVKWVQMLVSFNCKKLHGGSNE